MNFGLVSKHSLVPASRELDAIVFTESRTAWFSRFVLCSSTVFVIEDHGVARTAR